MADVDTGSGGGGKGKKKGTKKTSTKVDMTPMVDLAFLLITFFMLTTTFSKPQTMEVNMPDKNDKQETEKVKESQTTTIVLTREDKIVYYTGFENPVTSVTDFSENGIRNYLFSFQKKVKAEMGKDAIFIIKATKEARYKNVVDILDEMAITRAAIYAIVDVTKDDEELVEKALANPAAQATAAVN